MSERKSNFTWTNLDSSINFNFDIFDINSRHINKIKEQSISQGAKMQFHQPEDLYSNYHHFNIENTINFTDLAPKHFSNNQIHSPTHRNIQQDKEYSHSSIQAPSQNISRRGLKSLAALLLKILVKKQFSSHKQVAREIQKLLIKNTFKNKELLKEQKNIKRRIYDALNVMISVGILSRQQQTISFKHHSPLNSRNYSIVNKKDEYYDRVNAMKEQIQIKKQLLVALQEKRNALLSWKLKKKRLKQDQKVKLPFPLIFAVSDLTSKMQIDLCQQQFVCKSINMEIYSQTDILQQFNRARIQQQNNERTAIKVQEYIEIEYV